MGNRVQLTTVLTDQELPNAGLLPKVTLIKLIPPPRRAEQLQRPVTTGVLGALQSEYTALPNHVLLILVPVSIESRCKIHFITNPQCRAYLNTIKTGHAAAEIDFFGFQANTARFTVDRTMGTDSTSVLCDFDLK